ncbi:MAG: dTDP-glucose 4,6-dehydratase [Terriglobales bacterium]
MRILVTGGAGFIGANFVRYLLAQRSGCGIVNLDALTYAGNLENLADLESSRRHRFVHGDIRDRVLLDELLPGLDAVVHFAAESHVDRSILDATAFIRSNVEGTQTLLDAARHAQTPRFLFVSTDEVYGSLGAAGRFTETSPVAPTSPYAASKAAAELLVRAAFHTHRQPVVTTRASNNYGPYQFPEKFIPLVITHALNAEPIPVYGEGRNVRNWIHVQDHCAGILAALEHGQPGAVYNLGGDDELDNLSLVRHLLQLTGGAESLIRFVADRPGHDFRYSLDSTRARAELGWRPEVALEEGLRQTVAWYRQHAEWLAHVRDGSFRTYYQTQYAARLAHASDAPRGAGNAPPRLEHRQP